MVTKFRSRGVEAHTERPTTEGLLRHYRAHGLSEKEGYRGKERYKSYNALMTDPLVEVAFDWLGVESYVQVIEAIGYSEFRHEARADWEANHGN